MHWTSEPSLEAVRVCLCSRSKLLLAALAEPLRALSLDAGAHLRCTRWGREVASSPSGSQTLPQPVSKPSAHTMLLHFGFLQGWLPTKPAGHGPLSRCYPRGLAPAGGRALPGAAAPQQQVFTKAAGVESEQGSRSVSPSPVPGHLHPTRTAATALASQEWRVPPTNHGHDGTLARCIHHPTSAARSVPRCA